MSFEKRIELEPVRNINFGSITPVYAPISKPFLQAAKFLGILNLTDVALQFSLNGIDTIFTVQPQEFIPLFVNELAGNQSDIYFPKGGNIYVRHGGGPPTTGEVQTSRGIVQ